MRAVVITPTTGLPELAQAIQSVAKHGANVEHWHDIYKTFPWSLE